MSGYSVDIETKDPGEQLLSRGAVYGAAQPVGRHDTCRSVRRSARRLTPTAISSSVVEAGQGEAILDGERHTLSDGSAVVIPAGTEHNVINTSASEPLRLYTIYSPPEHPDGTINRTKQEALEYERTHHG